MRMILICSEKKIKLRADLLVLPWLRRQCRVKLKGIGKLLSSFLPIAFSV
jgi:hypothetical protein